MCNPGAVALLQSTQTVVQQLQARQSAETSRDISRVEIKSDRVRSANEQIDNNRRLIEQRAALAADLDSVSQESRRRIGAATVQAAEGGAGGNAVAALLRDFKSAELDFVTGTRRQDDFNTSQATRANEQSERNRRARGFNSRSRILPAPTFLSSVLAVTSSGVAGFASSGGFSSGG